MKLHRYFSSILLLTVLITFLSTPLISFADITTTSDGDITTTRDGDITTTRDGDITTTRTGGNTKINNPLSSETTSITDLLSFIINDIVLPIGMTIAVLFLIYAGFLFVTAQGNETKLQKAKSTFMWTVIGATILLGAWTIAQAIQGTICEITDIPGIC